MTRSRKVPLGVPAHRLWGQIDSTPLVDLHGRGHVVVRVYPPGSTASERRALGVLYFLRSALGMVTVLFLAVAAGLVTGRWLATAGLVVVAAAIGVMLRVVWARAYGSTLEVSAPLVRVHLRRPLRTQVEVHPAHQQGFERLVSSLNELEQVDDPAAREMRWWRVYEAMPSSLSGAPFREDP